MTGRRFPPFGIAIPIAVAIPAEQPQLRHDDFDDLPGIALSVVVLARLQPTFDKEELPGCHVLPRDLTQFVPADAAKPFHTVGFVTVTGFERLIDGERETGHRLASRREFQLCIPTRAPDHYR